MAGDIDKRNAWRPLKFSSVVELQRQIDKYFRDCDPHWVQTIVWENLPADAVIIEKPDKRGRVTKTDDQGNLVFGNQVRRKKMSMTPQVPYNIVDLAIALKTTRDTLLDYEKGTHDGKDDNAPEGLNFSDTIKDAKHRVLAYSERGLQNGKQAVGIIFSLKNNFGYKDQSQVENETKVTHRFEDMDDDQLDAAIQEREADLPPAA